MRILIVAMVNSIHTVRWVTQFDKDDEKDIYLFPSVLGGARAELSGWTRLYSICPLWRDSTRALIMHLPLRKLNGAFHLIMHKLFGSAWRVRWLIKTIKRLNPDIIHSLEFQGAGYVCLAAKEKMGPNFPTWIATNWGSDIYYFSRQPEHLERIKGVLKHADFYSAECARDYNLATGLGMTALPLPIIPNSGGMHLPAIENLRNKIPTSQRKLLLIKGYQTVFGRALHALQALEKIAALLDGYKVCVFLATPEVEDASNLIAKRTGLDIEVIPLKHALSHEEILNLHAQARAYVGLSVSDGISTSMLEAMALGAFPVQTCTSCANEWIEDGVSGFIAPCDDMNSLSQMILRAMTDDILVDQASSLNWSTISSKAEYSRVRDIARSFYETAFTYARAKKIS